MILYEFGVMSSKWSVEADNEIVAKCAMLLYIQQNIPIAVYSPEHVSSFIPMDFLNDNPNILDRERNSIMASLKTIKEVKL